MRNGNFIEYILDSESKDESCSIISSHQHLAMIDDSNCDANSSNLLDQNHNVNKSFNNSTNEIKRFERSSLSSSSKFSSPPTSQFELNGCKDGVCRDNSKNSSYLNDLKRQSSPISGAIRSNSMLSSTTTTTASSSSFSTKPSATSATATTASSSLSSTSVLNQSQQQQSKPSETKSNSLSSMKRRSMSASSSILNEMTNQNAEIFINIYWPVKNRTEIQILNYQTAFDVIKQMLHNQVYAPISMNLKRNRSNSSFNLSRIEENTQYAYALRLICRNSKTNSDQIWIHPIENMMEFLNQNKHLIEKGWKLELRIRYLPSNLEEFYRNDYLSFKFLYEQVLEEFFSLELSTTKLLSNQDLILELGCYEIFRTHPYLTPQGLEKNSNWEALENDFHRIFPISFTNSMKVKLFDYCFYCCWIFFLT